MAWTTRAFDGEPRPRFPRGGRAFGRGRRHRGRRWRDHRHARPAHRTCRRAAPDVAGADRMAGGRGADRAGRLGRLTKARAVCAPAAFNAAVPAASVAMVIPGFRRSEVRRDQPFHLGLEDGAGFPRPVTLGIVAGYQYAGASPEAWRIAEH